MPTLVGTLGTSTKVDGYQNLPRREPVGAKVGWHAAMIR